jgi:hypothetical protein
METFAAELPEFLRRHDPRRPRFGVPSEAEISQVANILVLAHGQRAVQEATMLLDGVIAQRNAEGEAAWRWVVDVVLRLLANESRGSVN